MLKYIKKNIIQGQTNQGAVIILEFLSVVDQRRRNDFKQKKRPANFKKPDEAMKENSTTLLLRLFACTDLIIYFYISEYELINRRKAV